MEKYKTGTGQIIHRVHDREQCAGDNCCIHRPSKHHMRDFPTHWRDDRMLMERICPHGVGHPDPDDLEFKKKHGIDDGVHGCCGCCNEDVFNKKVASGEIVREEQVILDESGFSSGAGVVNYKWVLAKEKK